MKPSMLLSSPTRRLLVAAFMLMVFGGHSSQLQAQTPSPETCGPIQNGYGPFDYRNERDKLGIVEGSHFTPVVEALIRGQSGYIGGDIDYTLRASPNHHRALVALTRLGDRLKVDKVPNTSYSVECYYERALRFRRDDTTVRMLYAQFLAERQRPQEAAQQLELAKNYAGNNGFTHYNIGMVYFELNDAAHALEQAHIAQSLGFDRTDLKDKLQAAGKWMDPPAGAASAPQAAPLPPSAASSAAELPAPAAAASR